MKMNEGKNMRAETAAAAAAEMKARLRAARRVIGSALVLRRGLAWSAILAATATAFALADNFFHLPGAVRAVLGLLWPAGAVVSLFVWVLEPFARRLSDSAAAVRLEKKLGLNDNLLVNAVQLHARFSSEGGEEGGNGKVPGGGAGTGGVSTAMVGRVVEEAAARATRADLSPLWERRRLRKAGLSAFAAVTATVCYAVLRPDYAANALQRYLHPLSDVPPPADTRVWYYVAGEKNGVVEALAGDRLIAYGLARTKGGEPPRRAEVLVETSGGARRVPMTPADRLPPPAKKLVRGKAASFSCEFSEVRESFSFRVVAGDGRSRACRVEVRPRPGVAELRLKLTPPEYTGLQPVSAPAPHGLVRAPSGSRAELRFRPTKKLTAARLLPPGEKAVAAAPAPAGRWRATFSVEKEGSWFLSLTATDGTKDAAAFEGRVVPLTDSPPVVMFENRTLNVAALPGATVAPAVRARDDYGLKFLRLVVERPEADEVKAGTGQGKDAAPPPVLKTWRWPRPGAKTASELYPLKLDPARFVPGGTYVVYAEAADHRPGGRVARSAPFVIRILTAEQTTLRENSPYAPIFQRLRNLIAAQTKARGKTVTVREFLREIMRKHLLPRRLRSILDSQRAVNSAARDLAAELKPAASSKRGKNALGGTNALAAELNALLAGPMKRAVDDLRNLAPAPRARPTRNRTAAALRDEETAQTEVINRLTALLGTVAALDDAKEKDAAADLRDDDEQQRLRDKLKDAEQQVGKFIAAQKRLIKSTEELDDKDPDDLTEEDKKQLGDLAKDEADWAKYFREKFTDLSKVPDQDFSDSKLAKEFNEVYQEIQKAAESLQDQNVEMAVPNEQAGLELAEKLETNLERWLPDTRDTQKWNMEEPQGEFDVPLSELPDELEDIIGELVDDEEEMSDDVEDVSSSWMDSLDQGAGWGASDGNISNMSAKGVTGNRLPNQQEIGGRSGEGRSGKSHGQFVEESADGKGGRQTPSRTTPDPYEEGRVDDKSEDALGGATGGGKTAGAAAGGLRGTPPPETAAKLERLKSLQTSMRQQAEKIVVRLRAYHLPASEMEEAVRRMKSLETHLQSGRGFNLRQAHAAVLDKLKRAKKIVGLQAKVNKERSRDLPKRVRTQILSGMRQKAPDGYQDLLEAYYRALVEKKAE